MSSKYSKRINKIKNQLSELEDKKQSLMKELDFLQDLEEFNSGKFSNSTRGLRVVKLGAL